ncbi:unnamed protein product [Urochloa decumbens]|uniref:FBD domain-containing protein n=1 Tax=Urochloa decumbens TaxID=240449 RepID=A0ABC9FB85_9POAL
MLSCRCPSLKKLELEWVSIALQDGATTVLSLHSGSLEWLQIVGIQFDGRLQVAAPKLRTFHGRIIPCEFYMAAPMLAEFCWHDNNCDYNGYDPTRRRLAVAAAHRLRRLQIDASSSGLELMRRFKTVDELDLTVHVTQDIEEYARFLEDTNILASCEVLVVRFTKMEHTFTSAMLHLLKQCARVRKLVVQLSSNMDDYLCKLFSECPCRNLPENRKQIRNTVLGLLEEAEVMDHGEAHNTVELVRLLCKCTKIQKRVAITVSGSKQSEHIRMKVHSIVSPNTKVEIFVR